MTSLRPSYDRLLAYIHTKESPCNAKILFPTNRAVHDNNWLEKIILRRASQRMQLLSDLLFAFNFLHLSDFHSLPALHFVFELINGLELMRIGSKRCG